MKKVLLAAILMLSVGVAANAQFKLGAKAGMNITGVNVSDADLKIGFSIGALSQIKLGDKWAVQPEVLFNMQGFKAKEDDVKKSFNLGYISVPIMAQFYITKNLNVELGPQLGFLIFAKSKGGGESVKIKSDMETVEFALGAGAAYELAKLPIGFFARYTYGFTEIAKPSLGKDVKNYGVQVGAFVKF